MRRNNASGDLTGLTSIRPHRHTPTLAIYWRPTAPVKEKREKSTTFPLTYFLYNKNKWFSTNRYGFPSVIHLTFCSHIPNPPNSK